jgi:nucleoside-diphosphate-sugar epimerase
MADVYLGKPLEESGLPGTAAGYVDVRDVARLVIFGAEHPEKADGQRFITASARSPAQAVADILRKQYPERRDIIKEGTPGEGYAEGYVQKGGVVYDGSKAAKATGQGYIPWEKTVVDTVEKLRPILD